MDENEVDIGSYDRTVENASIDVNISEIRTKPSFDPNELYYDMTRKKYLYIFNHYKYQKTRYFNNRLPSTREGTYKDVSRLTEVFRSLGFEVMTYHDKEHGQIIDAVTEISKRDHKDTSCLFFAFLTHGEKGGELFAADRPYAFKDVLVLLEHGHETLVTKPKVFFVQACRGDRVDDGRRVQLDGSSSSYVVPTTADFLVVYSTVEDYLSYRDREGSFMIQELCNIIEAYHEQWDLLQLLTWVHRNVAQRHTYAPSVQAHHNKKQMPETKYSLTKLIKL